jgi:sn-glycerol 3-phosphate transport system permease protein
LCTLAAYAFARFDFAGRNIAFALVLVQLMVMPEVLIVENYITMAKLGLVDTIAGIGLPYMASAFGIFLLRPDVQDDPARAGRGGARRRLLDDGRAVARVRAPRAPDLPRLRAGLGELPLEQLPLAAHHHELVNTRPLTVGLAIFGAPESGVDWAVISAGTLMAVSPLLVAFLLFQRQFMQSFMQAGIK